MERRHLDRKTPWRLVKKYCRGRRHRPRRGWEAAGSASTRCARRPSTTPSATGPRCTRCGSSPATPTSARPRSTSSARRKTPRWRPGGSRSALCDRADRDLNPGDRIHRGHEDAQTIARESNGSITCSPKWTSGSGGSGRSACW